MFKTVANFFSYLFASKELKAAVGDVPQEPVTPFTRAMELYDTMETGMFCCGFTVNEEAILGAFKLQFPSLYIIYSNFQRGGDFPSEFHTMARTASECLLFKQIEVEGGELARNNKVADWILLLPEELRDDVIKARKNLPQIIHDLVEVEEAAKELV